MKLRPGQNRDGISKYYIDKCKLVSNLKVKPEIMRKKCQLLISHILET